MTEWLMLLGAVIQKFKPGPGDDQVGGSMSNPAMQGWVKKASHNFHDGWNRRYMAVKEGRLCYYSKYDDFKAGNPICTINTQLVTVKVGQGSKAKSHQFQLVTHQRKFDFQALSKEELAAWVSAIQTSILWSLNQGMAVTSEARNIKQAIPPEKALEMLRENPDNNYCADCGEKAPEWSSISLGIMICLNCCGIHRSLGVHISKVRSATLDEWTPNLLDVVKGIGSLRSNMFWEYGMRNEKPTPDMDQAAKQVYIVKKYAQRAFLPPDFVNTSRPLEEQLIDVVKTNKLMETVKLITALSMRDETQRFQSYTDPATGHSICYFARQAEQAVQEELLSCNGFKLLDTEEQESACSMSLVGDDLTPTHFESFLSKRGHQNTDWKERWCVYHLGTMSYYRSDVETEPAGCIPIEDISKIFSFVESDPDPDHAYCFKVETVENKVFIFSAAIEELRKEWITMLQRNMDQLPPDAKLPRGFDFSGFDRIGPLWKRGEGNKAYKKRFFGLRGKELLYFESQDNRALLGVIDLVVVTNVFEGDAPSQPNPAAELEFGLQTATRVYQLKAANQQDLEEWLQALRWVNVFGSPLERSPTVIPVVVDKCIDYIELMGVTEEGIYRVPGNNTNIKELKDLFNRDDQAVHLASTDYSIHDVGGVLKQYFRDLPDPLIAAQCRGAFIAAGRLADPATRTTQLQACIQVCPKLTVRHSRDCAHTWH
jgi:hypothetical protein